MKFFIFLIGLSLSFNTFAFTLEDFDKTRENFFSIYSPIVKEASGLNLQIKYDYDVKDYFGGMNVEAGNMQILIGSELDRAAGMTPDFYAFILCHEIGHLLGGLPKKITRGKGALYSSEGQSDYFAASVCLKKIFENDSGPTTPVIVSARVKSLCQVNTASIHESLICERIANAGREFFVYLQTMYRQYYNLDFPVPDMDTPEAAGVSTKPEYPSFQCRLDTIIAGATSSDRPLCWYQP